MRQHDRAVLRRAAEELDRFGELLEKATAQAQLIVDNYDEELRRYSCQEENTNLLRLFGEHAHLRAQILRECIAEDDEFRATVAARKKEPPSA